MLRTKEKIIRNFEIQKMLFYCLLFILASSLLSYGYLIRGTIVNIVERQTMITELAIANSNVLELESQYIKAKNNIDLELAKELGFISAPVQKFVIRNTKMPALSVLDNSI